MEYERYAQFRDKANMTDCGVAKACGFRPSTLCDWKAGRYKPKLDKLIKISGLLGVPLGEFLGCEEG